MFEQNFFMEAILYPSIQWVITLSVRELDLYLRKLVGSRPAAE